MGVRAFARGSGQARPSWRRRARVRARRGAGSSLGRCRSRACACSRWTRRRSCRRAPSVENGPPTAAYPRLKEIEFRGEDFNAFRSLALSDCHVATLSHATGGVLDRSERHGDIRARSGFGDELRAVLVDGQDDVGRAGAAAWIGSPRRFRPPTRSWWQR